MNSCTTFLLARVGFVLADCLESFSMRLEVVSSEDTLARVFTCMGANYLAVFLLLLLTCSFVYSPTWGARMTSTRAVTWSKAKKLPGNPFQKKLYFSSTQAGGGGGVPLDLLLWP